jgi:hypothetical protein
VRTIRRVQQRESQIAHFVIAITFAEAIAGQSCAPAATRSLEEQLAATEILLIDLGASSEELAAALGPDGYAL